MVNFLRWTECFMAASDGYNLLTITKTTNNVFIDFFPPQSTLHKVSIRGLQVEGSSFIPSSALKPKVNLFLYAYARVPVQCA